MDSDKQALREKIAKILAPEPIVYIFSPNAFYTVEDGFKEIILVPTPKEEPLHG